MKVTSMLSLGFTTGAVALVIAVVSATALGDEVGEKYRAIYKQQLTDILGGRNAPTTKSEAQRVLTLVQQYDGALVKRQTVLTSAGNRAGGDELATMRRSLATSPEYLAIGRLLSASPPEKRLKLQAASPPKKRLKGLSPELKSKLLLHYDFSRRESGRVTDRSGKMNHGKARGTTWTMHGKVGGAVQFNGKRDYIEVGKPLAVGNRDHTIAVWVRIPAVGKENLEADERVGIVLGNFGATGDELVSWEITKAGRMLLWWNSGEVVVGNRHDLRDGAWHHIAWVRDKAANGFTLYLDGQREQFISGVGSDVQFRSKHRLGADHRANNVPYFHGSMDELMVFSKALSQEEVASLYGTGSTDGAPYQYKMPSNIGDGWPIAHAKSLGVDVEKLAGLVQANRSGEYRNIHAIVIACRGKLVLDEYFSGYNPKRKHAIASISKALTASTTGIAAGQKRFQGASLLLKDALPKYGAGFEGQKKLITVDHMLAMRTGLEWKESAYAYTDPRNSHRIMDKSEDVLEYVLGRPMEATPGEKYQYNSGVAMTLGRVFEIQTGEDVASFAKRHLFGPLGITDYKWNLYRKLVNTGGGLAMRARDLAKYGSLHLSEGKWNGRQVIPAAWVERSMQRPDRKISYVDHWFINAPFVLPDREKPIDVFRSTGYGGQHIYLVPELDLLAVFNAANFEDQMVGHPEDMFYKYILPAVRGSDYEYRNGACLLVRAAAAGDLGRVKELVERGAGLEWRNQWGSTPLMCATDQSRLEVMSYLISKGADTEARNNEKTTPLGHVSYHGKSDAVRLLVKHRADVNPAGNRFGYTPLLYAAMQGHTEIVRLLVEAGADVKQTDSQGNTALTFAENKGHAGIVKYLSGK
jgi:CubicO group peptidase (beta-lactamase class C family)